MNKAVLQKKILEVLGENLAVLERAARASHVEATHESSRAESKYDTRGLEAAYLAGGQARQAREIMDAIKIYQSLPMREYGPNDAIDLTALVTLQMNSTESMYFIGPKGGGLEVEHKGAEIVVVTPQSPMGANLIGKKFDQKWTAKVGGSTVKYHIAKVW